MVEAVFPIIVVNGFWVSGRDQMEHRHGARSRVNISAIAELNSGGTAPARIVNVSVGGLFLKASPELFSAYSPLRVTYMLRRDNKEVLCRWRGFVVRTASDGVGAMFESADPVEQSALLALLDTAEMKSNDW